MDKILIKDLRIDTIVGIREHERVKEQTIALDITLELPLRECAKSGDLSKSINYSEVCTQVTKFVREKKALLVETLAEELCEFILERFHTKQVTLSLLKTQAVPNTQGVGVEITRSLEDYAHR